MVSQLCLVIIISIKLLMKFLIDEVVVNELMILMNLLFCVLFSVDCCCKEEDFLESEMEINSASSMRMGNSDGMKLNHGGVGTEETDSSHPQRHQEGHKRTTSIQHIRIPLANRKPVKFRSASEF